MKKVTDLQPGDLIVFARMYDTCKVCDSQLQPTQDDPDDYIHSDDDHEDHRPVRKDTFTAVLILRERETYRDLFDREMLRFWARRRDTGAEGWMCYGPEANVNEQSDFTPDQLEAGGFWKC